MNEWVVILDDDELSKKQLEVCKLLKPQLKGVIMCSDANMNEEASQVCKNVDYFPAFCNLNNNTCTYGVRTNLEELTELTQLAPQSHTTTQPPPQTHKLE